MRLKVVITVLFFFSFPYSRTLAVEVDDDHESEHETETGERQENEEKEEEPLTGDRFSFFKFRGPVSGEVSAVPVKSDTHPSGQSIDHVAKPDYSFAFGVHDRSSGNSQTHRESRDGDSVHGEYRVLQADGLVRIVRYTANPDTGFIANVEYVKM